MRCESRTTKGARCKREGTLYLQHDGKEYLVCSAHYKDGFRPCKSDEAKAAAPETMDANPFTFADMIRADVEAGDSGAVRQLYSHVWRELEAGRPVDNATLLLLLEALMPGEVTDKQEQYDEVFRAIMARQAKAKCSFYQAVKDYRKGLIELIVPQAKGRDIDYRKGLEELLGSDDELIKSAEKYRHCLSPLQNTLVEKAFDEAFEQLKRAHPPGMKMRNARRRGT